MKIDEFVDQPGSWLAPEQGDVIAISSRVRLARNLSDTRFPGWGGDRECVRIWEMLKPVLEQLTTLDHPLVTGMKELKKLDRAILFERHLISREHAKKISGSGLVVRVDERVSIMVNEEDHLRLQAMRPGLDLSVAWKAIDAVDTELEQKVRYAFSPRWGYLTACPSNVGTGMRASVMLHLPALVLLDEMNPIVKGLGKIGLAVRGLWGEGTEACGNMFQISNQMTLGAKEEEIIENLQQIVQEIVEHEKKARIRLMEQKELMVRDQIGRSEGILSGAHILSSKEALDLLSGLRLGMDLGIVTLKDQKMISELLLLTQPAHLQKLEGRRLKAEERDEVRARLVRTKLRDAKVKRRKGNRT